MHLTTLLSQFRYKNLQPPKIRGPPKKGSYFASAKQSLDSSLAIYLGFDGLLSLLLVPLQVLGRLLSNVRPPPPLSTRL